MTRRRDEGRQQDRGEHPRMRRRRVSRRSPATTNIRFQRCGQRTSGPQRTGNRARNITGCRHRSKKTHAKGGPAAVNVTAGSSARGAPAPQREQHRQSNRHADDGPLLPAATEQYLHSACHCRSPARQPINHQRDRVHRTRSARESTSISGREADSTEPTSAHVHPLTAIVMSCRRAPSSRAARAGCASSTSARRSRRRSAAATAAAARPAPAHRSLRAA